MEIEAVLNFQKVNYLSVHVDGQIYIIQTQKPLATDELMARLGGTVKIAIIEKILTPEVARQADNLEQNIFQVIDKHFPAGSDKKFQFGFSVFGGLNYQELKIIGLRIKKNLSGRDVKTRLVVSKELILSSVIVQKERLIEQGLDILIIKTNNQLLIGRTVAVQRFDEYSRRDYGRPQRDDKSGMLPPKLAKIMINLSQTGKGQTILDPFCGSGTILQEALFLGYKKLIGSDISEKAVAATKQNLNWLKEKFGLDTSGVKIFKCDARNLASKLKPATADAVVTEPYLGPVDSAKIPNLSELTELYTQSLSSIRTILKKSGRAVIILPIIGGKRFDILGEIERLGYVVNKLNNSSRGSVVYFRPNQRVLREIFVFTKLSGH